MRKGGPLKGGNKRSRVLLFSSLFKGLTVVFWTRVKAVQRRLTQLKTTDLPGNEYLGTTYLFGNN